MSQFSAYDQLLLELVNRARLDPLAEAQRLGVGLNSGLEANRIDALSKQPLAPNDILRNAALSHSNWMLQTDTFSHKGAAGLNGFARMSNAGYDFSVGPWRWGENIGWWGHTAGGDPLQHLLNVHDNLFRSPSHRVNILHEDFRELGVGTSTGVFTSNAANYQSLMATENFGRVGAAYFITGVAFSDRDGDQFYDIGEGVAGLRVSLLDASGRAITQTASGSSGGYGLQLPHDTVNVEFSGGELAAPVRIKIDADGENAKVDMLNSGLILSSADTTLGLNARNLTLLGIDALALTGNELDNTLTGNKGANRINGGFGNDQIAGGAGNDVLLGGAGSDTIAGGAGLDRLEGGDDVDTLHGDDGADAILGGRGNDLLFGDAGNDILIGGAGRDVISGGSGSDTFMFNELADSAAQRPLRDVIVDFDPRFDTLDFRRLDANTRLPGDQSFSWAGETWASDGTTAGRVGFRQIDFAGTSSDFTLVWADVNGDRVADFQVELVGLMRLEASDFLL